MCVGVMVRTPWGHKKQYQFIPNFRIAEGEHNAWYKRIEESANMSSCCFTCALAQVTIKTKRLKRGLVNSCVRTFQDESVAWIRLHNEDKLNRSRNTNWTRDTSKKEQCVMKISLTEVGIRVGRGTLRSQVSGGVRMI